MYYPIYIRFQKIKTIVTQSTPMFAWGRGEEGWQEGGIAKEHKETFEDDGNVYHLDCGDGFTWVNRSKLTKFTF